MGYFFRLLQLFSTCVAFSLMASVGNWRATTSNWSTFIFCFCFVVTLIIFIVELCELQYRFPFHWGNFLITWACYFTLFSLSASIIFATTYVQFFPCGPHWDQAITASAFCFISSMVYAAEAIWIWSWPRTGDFSGYLGSVTGLLKVLENLVAYVIFAFISNTDLYQHQPALMWCVAVYSICFILGAVVILLNLVDCENRLPTSFSPFLLGLTLLSILFYASALVLWSLYQFDEKFGGQPQRSSDVSCSDGLTNYVCAWDQRLAVAILTAVNLLIYVADLVNLARLYFVEIEDQPTVS
ncbi:myeloid-associated differentiation marker-like [Camelus bactrianus]|nr:myeloid-associated differentiation marker-like protein [Camelus ferus]